jgi:hypothetical protein
MHSMVRYNALKRSDKWDLDVYGIPIPQVDQMPAGLINVYLLAAQVLKKNRTEFTTPERAVVEFGRYRSHLLGLPEELLPETPEAIIRVMHARAALLRDGFDDDTCGELVRATMAAHLRPTRSLPDRVGNSVEKSYSKAFFIRAFAGNDRKRAAEMGVDFGVGDLVRIAATAPFHIARFAVVNVASQIPVVQKVADSYLTRLLGKRLVDYGRPEYTTDANTYSGTRTAGAATAPA